MNKSVKSMGWPSTLKKRHAQLLILVILTVLAVTTRLFPLSISSYPFNNDGLTECTIATDILSLQDLDFAADRYYFGSHSVITPAYDIVLAFFSSVVGLSPFEIAQLMVATFSIVTVLGGYVIAMRFSGSVKGSIATALTLCLFGTFVFLTGSAWKESLAVALLIMIMYSYIHRDDKRMFALGIILLSVLPIVHHLVTGIAYLAVWLLTIWSTSFALTNGRIRWSHLRDIATISLLSIGTLVYYHLTTLDRLSLVLDDNYSIFRLSLVLAGMTSLIFVLLRKRTHSKFSMAPILAIIVFAVVLWDYLDPVFSYERGSPLPVLVLAGTMSILIGIGWFGLEVMIKTKSRYRAIPIALLTPVLVVILFSLVDKTGLSSHWMIYRTYDFADIPLALGVAASIGYLRLRPKGEIALVTCLIVALVISFPFAYFTGPLTGIRHDTQAHEVDAFGWIYYNAGDEIRIQTDERLGYIGMAMFNFSKEPFLPGRLTGDERLPMDWYYMLEEEWTTVGVNDYPYGHPVINETRVDIVLTSSNVYYVGGPESNSVLIFSSSELGYSEIT